eukprot:1259470-Amphidinium_carterae.1
MREILRELIGTADVRKLFRMTRTTYYTHKEVLSTQKSGADKCCRMVLHKGRHYIARASTLSDWSSQPHRSEMYVVIPLEQDSRE